MTSQFARIVQKENVQAPGLTEERENNENELFFEQQD